MEEDVNVTYDDCHRTIEYVTYRSNVNATFDAIDDATNYATCVAIRIDTYSVARSATFNIINSVVDDLLKEIL